ncbi:RluA family pseudouridine synthase [Thermosulfurimonas dismutans]|uniref:RNA pseudouridylate synthase, group 1 n=1 Tax=Thermosulfurimonas dismutans TaxID=999894 RepID=A0A179D393_9BACT|nr:RluA family pseudouridine synthase [Thermosulfurimonas dismutans]OAQ20271.1 RNA pseudouridylate synthase, group 1 [Thermosulfurimonas dismutans]
MKMNMEQKPAGVKESLKILYEDNHLLAIEKPGGLLIQGDRTGDPTLLEAAKAYLKEKYRKPGGVYLGLVHRLDRVTSGVVLLAKTSKAAARLSEVFREGGVRKAYLAVVEGHLSEEAGIMKAYLRWDARLGRTLVSETPREGFRKAVTGFKVVGRFKGSTALLLFPETGRKHQLRAQLAHIGHPVMGDRRYGSRRRVLSGKAILLHALALALMHPIKRFPLFLFAPLPSYFPSIPCESKDLKAFLLPDGQNNF